MRRELIHIFNEVSIKIEPNLKSQDQGPWHPWKLQEVRHSLCEPLDGCSLASILSSTQGHPLGTSGLQS